MKVTVLTTRLFSRPASGGELCTARLLQALHDAGHQVRLIGRGGAPGALSIGPAEPAFDDQPLHRRVLCLAGAWATGQASTVYRLGAGGAARCAAQALLAAPMDALVVDHLQPWAWVQPLRQRLPAPLLVLHNLEAAGYAAQAQRASGLRRQVLRREAALLAALEGDALHHAAAVACLSDADAQALPPGPAPRLLLPGYPLDGVPPDGPGPVVRGGQVVVGLIGTWTWAPNRAALRWMLAEVLPRLGPHCRLVLAGSGLDPLPLPLPAGTAARVRVLGQVADVADFYRQVDVVALPSLLGSGVQEKAIEAIARARAVVATPHALRGLGPGLPPHVQHATSAGDFAAACGLARPGSPADRLAVQRWAVRRAARYQQQLLRGLLASAASRTMADAPHPAPAARPHPAR